jgi:hypothetical protein
MHLAVLCVATALQLVWEERGLLTPRLRNGQKEKMVHGNPWHATAWR